VPESKTFSSSRYYFGENISSLGKSKHHYGSWLGVFLWYCQ